jgi:hypothetical protein
MPETFDWLKPSLLWQRGGLDIRQPDFFRPALLEFSTDKFMEEFLSAITAKPASVFQQMVMDEIAPGENLKFYQPAHGRFYLTCGSLCCRIPGFPDREVQTASNESVFFVLRKKAGNAEYGWCGVEKNRSWKSLEDRPRRVLEMEERLPLVLTNAGNNRALFYGYIPVSSQETYQSSQPNETPITVSNADTRRDEFESKITQTLKMLLDLGQNLATDIEKPGQPTPTPAQVESVKETTLFWLLDLSAFLSTNAPSVDQAIRGVPPQPALTSNQSALRSFLTSKSIGSKTLAAALIDVESARQQIEQMKPGEPLPKDYSLWSMSGWTPDELENAFFPASGAAVLKQYEPPTALPAIESPKFSMFGGEKIDQYVLRFVYERAQCDPAHHYISQESLPFHLAGFFDPDAPARPIRIALPTDVSVAGLRRLKKNVAFMMSTELRNKLASISGKEKELLNGAPPSSEGSFDIGHICSFSIPIITICAFILLMIILMLLNFVFWWLPFFKICFPLKLSAKG